MNGPSPVVERALRAEMRLARRLCSARDEQTQLDFDPDALNAEPADASPRVVRAGLCVEGERGSIGHAYDGTSPRRVGSVARPDTPLDGPAPALTYDKEGTW